MKLKLLVSLLFIGSVLSSFAQGYKDGVEYVKIGQLQKGKTLLDRNLNNAGTDKSASYYYLGRIEMEQGNVATAKDYFQKGVQANSLNAYNHVGLAFIDLKGGNEKVAKDAFKEAVKLDKKNADVYVEVARAYYLTDATKYAKEIDEYIVKAKKANKKDPAAYIFEGDMLTAEKKWGDAAGYYEMAQQFDPNCSEAYVKYANTYFNVSPKSAIERLETLVKLKPNSALAQNQLAEKLYENDQWTKAAQVYGEYIKNPNHFKEDRERYAVLLYFGEKYQESFDIAQGILKDNSNSFLMKRMLFLNSAAMNNNEAAEAYARDFFASATANDKFSSNDYTTFGEVLKALGKTEEALAQYEKAVEINPEKIELLKELSSAYGANKDYEKSALYYQKYIDNGDYKTNDLYVLAGKYQNIVATEKEDLAKRQAALDNALKYIDIVIEKVPDDYRIVQRKARILMVSEDSPKTGKALEAYQAVLNILDKDAANLTQNADAYKEAYNYIAGNKLENGDTAGAKEYYTKYLELDPTNEALRKFVEGLK